MGKIFIALLTMLCISCNTPDHPGNKVWAWMSGANSMTAEQWDYYFKKSSEAGIDAILLECHGGYPKTPDDTTSFRDSAAIEIITSALPYAKKYHIELHAWIWTMNRTEMNLRKAHPEWYQVNAAGES
ncbi:MAG: hypothetical protein PHR97_08755, partial [Bacteroidales bacterium]|nr:hypothetical protein [Bacteroidales bacterium]